MRAEYQIQIRHRDTSLVETLPIAPGNDAGLVSEHHAVGELEVTRHRVEQLGFDANVVLQKRVIPDFEDVDA